LFDVPRLALLLIGISGFIASRHDDLLSLIDSVDEEPPSDSAEKRLGKK
jgi:hypothetical protein